MCGIVCAWGKERHVWTRHALDRLSHRGPDAQALRDVGDLVVGFARLAINAIGDEGMQPLSQTTLTGVINGEIYNHLALREEFGLTSLGGSDMAVVLPLFATLGEGVLDRLDGFFSGVVYDSAANRLFTLRDAIGKKPLFLVSTDGTFMLTSALKSAMRVERFEEIPLGLCEIDMESGQIIQRALPRRPTPLSAKKSTPQALVTTMRRSINKRTACSDLASFAVFVSGGLDSSIIATLVHEGPDRDRAHYYYFDDPESEDAHYAALLLADLGVPASRIHPVSVPMMSEMPELISRVVEATESYNPSIISNGIGTYLLAQSARAGGHKVALGGDGADEMFCGYFDPPDFGPDRSWDTSRARLLADLQRTELRRVDGAAMAYGIEVRCPFLDHDLRDLAQGFTETDFYGDGPQPIRKRVLRQAFAAHLPPEIIARPKQSFDRGTGIQRLMILCCTRAGDSETDYLHAVWHSHFRDLLGHLDADPYFHSYPAFDMFLKTRGRRYTLPPENTGKM
ncbi:asparagine synthase B [Aliiroseovarius zhejiangensis]|uniref:asparagine synthase (glutamine-hydrolyzing) n=1 Tax=Aliiroseovarius zhejiangensis TaxID=1632025 RepID=A0ABQ3J4U1_9RHOB|nr:asparagine synthase-related protein [Aliiroseovarius zhejiangensis]GHF01549.1 asparagine synthase B [Aliiroseovarius zhejiangensis]